MNLNNLKPAWQQFRLMNSMQPINQEEILFILEKAEGMVVSRSYRLLLYISLFVVLTFGCQGG